MRLNRLAFIGVRGHYESVLRSLPRVPHVRVVGLCEGGTGPMHSHHEWCRTHGDVPMIRPDHQSLYHDARPDAVVICGPLEDHAAMAIDAIRSGIHVLVEKPAAISIDELESLRRAHELNPHVHLATMQTARYQPGFFTAWHLVNSGAIGDVRLINAQKSYKLGSRPQFYTRRDTYGGTIPWVGAHAIDWMLWIGGHRVRSVYATHTSAADTRVGTMELSALCHFTLCGNRYASVSIDVLRPSNAATHGDDRLRLVGSEGVIEVSPNSIKLINAENDGTRPVPLQTPPTMFEDFVDHIEGRRTALIDAEDTLATTAACLLARQAADEGRVLAAESLTTIPMQARARTLASNPHQNAAAVA